MIFQNNIEVDYDGELCYVLALSVVNKKCNKTVWLRALERESLT